MNEKLKTFNNLVKDEISDFSIKKLVKPEDQSDDIKNYLEDFKTNILIPIKDTGYYDNTTEFILLKPFFQIYLKNILIEMREDYNDYKSNDGISCSDYIIDLLELFELFEKPFFTLQRFSELLINPREHYNSFNKISFAFEKILNI